MIALLGRVVLVTVPCFSSLWIFHSSPFWPCCFCWEISWQPYGNSFVSYLLSLSCCLYDFLFVFNLCHFSYDLSYRGSLNWDSVFSELGFLVSLTFVPCQGKKSIYIFGWLKSPFSFLCKIKDTWFIFTNNFIDLDIFTISALSHVV